VKRTELERAIVVASNLIGHSEVLIIGSQAILGSFSESELPARATFSQEVDIAPLADDVAETLATRLDAGAGEWSPFERAHGFYIQGVSVRTAFLPSGWAERLVRVVPQHEPEVAGLCLEPHDLCAAKLARGDAKDHEYVAALIRARLVGAHEIAERVRSIDDDRLSLARRDIALGFLAKFSQ
jgi:hypothetical protein